MEDNSNTLLGGWESVTDVFGGNGLMNINDNTTNLDNYDDLSDEDIAKLQAESKKHVKSVKDVFGDTKKDEGAKDDDDTDDNQVDDEEKNTKTTNKVEKKSVDTTVDDDDNDDDNTGHSVDDDGGDDDEPSVESKQVTALFDAIAEELNWDFDEEEDTKPSTVEDLVKYFKDVIEENSVPQYANEQVAELDEFVRNGGKVEDYFSVTADIDYDNFDLTNESNQKQIVRQLLAEKGFSEKYITRRIEKYEDAGILEDEAEDALEAMKDISKKKKEELLESQKKDNEDRVANQQRFVDNVVGEIKALKDIRGINIPEKDKKALLEYIFKADSSGKTQYQKDYSKSVKNLIESAYFTMKGDLLIDTAKKIGSNSAIKNLKQSLRSTGVNKGARKASTSTKDVFSYAVQQLQ